MQTVIEEAWDLGDYTSQNVKLSVEKVIESLDTGKIRVAEHKDGKWFVNTWIKKAILLSFRIYKSEIIEINKKIKFFDKMTLKFESWEEKDFIQSQIRSLPGSFVRKSAYIAKNVVLMPSFVNVAAYVDSGTMIDTWATVGSCAQIGKNCHISGGAGIGGVLEPLQNNPVIIEDNCFIGARSEVAEGVIVKTGSVLSMGVYIGSSTKIVDRESGKVYYGEVPPYSVVVPGSQLTKNNVSLYCAVIVKTVDKRTREKVSINDLLRNK